VAGRHIESMVWHIIVLGEGENWVQSWFIDLYACSRGDLAVRRTLSIVWHNY
jgi:hypothetical protein